MIKLFFFLLVLGTVVYFVFNINIWIIALAIILIIFIFTASISNSGGSAMTSNDGWDFGGGDD